MVGNLSASHAAPRSEREFTGVNMSRLTHDLWASLPREIAPQMRSEIPDLAVEMVRAIEENVPGYARSADSEYSFGIQRGVEHALYEFVGRVGQSGSVFESAAKVHGSIGRAELRAGRSLDALQAAYRIGARLAWRRWAHIGTLAEASPAQMYLLAEAVFAHIDELAEHAVREYVAAWDLDKEVQRRKLMSLLLTASTPSSESLEEAARAARWESPERITAIALAKLGHDEVEFPSAALVDLEDPRPYLLVPGAPSAADGTWGNWARRALPKGSSAAVGPTVSLSEASTSLRLARQTVELVALGAIARPRYGIVGCADNVATLLLMQDTTLVRMLTERFLGPLAQLTLRQQERTVDTVLAWLTCQGGAPDVAKVLGVHPQTVRYRLRQAEETFGSALLRDPTAKIEFEMALRSWQLTRRMESKADVLVPVKEKAGEALKEKRVLVGAGQASLPVRPQSALSVQRIPRQSRRSMP
jgi:hypothetical protein